MSYLHTDQLVTQTGSLSIASSGSKGQRASSGSTDAFASASASAASAAAAAASPSNSSSSSSSAVPTADVGEFGDLGACAAAQPSPEIDVDLATQCAVDGASPITASPHDDGLTRFSLPGSAAAVVASGTHVCLSDLPNEILLHILGFLDVSDLLSTSRTSHHLRQLSLAPILHAYRLRRTRATLPPLLSSPSRPSLADLIARSIFLTHTSVVSRRLARSLVSISLARRLAARPAPETLVQRCVLPKECVPGLAGVHVAPALVARRKAIERERVKDGLRKWVAQVWKGEVRERGEGIKQWEDRVGVGRVWRLRRFWERVGKGEVAVESMP